VVIISGFGFSQRPATSDKRQTSSKLGMTEGIALGAAAGILSLAIHGLVDFNFHITANILVVALLAGIIMWRGSQYA